MRDRLDSEKISELVNRGKREITHCLKEWDNGLLSPKPSLAKHYLKSKLGLHLHKFNRNGHKLCAVFYPDQIGAVKNTATNGKQIQSNGVRNDNQELVFVHNV